MKTGEREKEERIGRMIGSLAEKEEKIGEKSKGRKKRR